VLVKANAVSQFVELMFTFLHRSDKLTAHDIISTDLTRHLPRRFVIPGHISLLVDEVAFNADCSAITCVTDGGVVFEDVAFDQ